MIEDDVDPRGRRAVEQLVMSGDCSAVDYRRETVSTNDLAIDHLRRTPEEHSETASENPTAAQLFLADHQTGGRGRRGRSWKSTDETLTFSLALFSDPNSKTRHLLSLAVGVAVARAIEQQLPLLTQLKWPNDVYVKGGKAAGVLMESVAGVPDRIIVGVGVNVGSRPDLGDDPRAGDVRDLSSSVGRKLHRYELLPAFVQQINRIVAQVDTIAAEILEEFRRRCLLNRQPVTYQHGAEIRHGLCRGIGDAGELLVDSDSGLQRLHSGEAHLVRVAR